MLHTEGGAGLKRVVKKELADGSVTHSGYDAAGRLTAQTDAAEHALEKRIQNAMDFVHATFGAGQELLIFLTRLKNLPGADAFLKENKRYRALCAEILPDELEKTL